MQPGGPARRDLCFEQDEGQDHRHCPPKQPWQQQESSPQRVPCLRVQSTVCFLSC